MIIISTPPVHTNGGVLIFKFRQMSIALLFEIIGTIIGILYLYYEYKANYMVWIMSAIMPLLSLYVYYESGLYADFGINIYYFLASISGYIAWKCHRNKEQSELPITHMPPSSYIPVIISTIIVFLLIYFVLTTYTDSSVALLDALTTALSIIAMWQLSRKYIEQWIVWLIVDIISVGLYIYKGIYFYASLYFVYSIVAIIGYIHWKKLMNNDNN